MIDSNLSKRIYSSIILIPLVLFFIIKGSFYFNFFIAICFFISAYEWYIMTRKKNYYLIIGLYFLIFSFYCAYLLRNLNGDIFGLLFLFVLLICISSDIGGYLVGKALKGPKLTKISPNKTYSGVLGAYVLSIITIYFFIYYCSMNYTKIMDFTFNTIITIILISTISQLGDILVSYFKRLSKIKDTGKIIPGHGGLLDRIDGMIFAFPFSYIIFITVIF